MIPLPSIQNYLDEKVTPIILGALKSICKDRPNDPVDYLINYLLQYKRSHNAFPAIPQLGMPIQM
ncbi:hypothetical protein MXB_1749, partial [Myxobolus squamalis]